MKPVRIIPCLDIKDGRVVKGVKFVNLKDARDPVEAAAAYCAEGADELVFLDIAASIEGRATRLDWVKKVKEVTTVPFCVGGGIRDLEDMQALFNLGADKVSINTAAVRNPALIKEASERFGKEKVVVAIDGKKNPPGSVRPRLEVLIMGGEEPTGLDVIKWAKGAEQLGAGEILLTSKDADGTKAGYDIELTRLVSESVNIPVTASGGAGKLEHFYEVITEGKADAVLAASVFHYGEFRIKEVKDYLLSRGINVII